MQIECTSDSIVSKVYSFERFAQFLSKVSFYKEFIVIINCRISHYNRHKIVGLFSKPFRRARFCKDIIT